MKILVIEDEVKTAKFLKKGLSEAGYVIDVAADGLEGLHLAQEVDFDLVILDVMLPKLDGWQVLVRLRETEQKALVLNLVLAQAARLSRAESAPNPILLLDEVAAHLDQVRRAALFDEIEALGLQAFLTGTDEALFYDLKGRAQGVGVDAGKLATDDT